MFSEVNFPNQRKLSVNHTENELSINSSEWMTKPNHWLPVYKFQSWGKQVANQSCGKLSGKHALSDLGYGNMH